jgi:hypothetical protein
LQRKICYYFYIKSLEDGNWVWWLTFVIPALGRLRQEEHKFKARLGYIVRSCLKQLKKNNE